MFKDKYSPARKQQGLTLIEIMIALFIGVFLLSGILEIFINAKRTYRIQDALSGIQENGRLAMDYIGRDLRTAGYRPAACPNYQFSATRPPLSGVDNDADSSNQTLNGTDSITFNWVVPANCTNINDPGGLASYVINKTSKTLQRGAYDLVDGVENMQILYGIDTTGDGVADYYSGGAGENVAMPHVVAVRVSLLVSSVEDVATKPIPYYYNDTSYTPATTDLKIRRAFTSTFAVRNSLQ